MEIRNKLKTSHKPPFTSSLRKRLEKTGEGSGAENLREEKGRE